MVAVPRFLRRRSVPELGSGWRAARLIPEKSPMIAGRTQPTHHRGYNPRSFASVSFMACENTIVAYPGQTDGNGSEQRLGHMAEIKNLPKGAFRVGSPAASVECCQSRKGSNDEVHHALRGIAKSGQGHDPTTSCVRDLLSMKLSALQRDFVPACIPSLPTRQDSRSLALRLSGRRSGPRTYCACRLPRRVAFATATARDTQTEGLQLFLDAHAHRGVRDIWRLAQSATTRNPCTTPNRIPSSP